MAMTSWQLSGDDFEACSCDSLCLCLPANRIAPPTTGDCHVAMVFHIDQGRYDALTLDGRDFAVVGCTPTLMSQAHGSVGLLLDERATVDQQHAMSTIASRQAGGPNPANTRLAPGRATQSRLHVFGLDWDETSGQNHGHFAPFHWQN